MKRLTAAERSVRADVVPATEVIDDTLSRLFELAGSISDELNALRFSRTAGSLLAESANYANPLNFTQRVAKFKRLLVAVALASAGGNQALAARRLGLKPTTLHEMIKRWEDAGK